MKLQIWLEACNLYIFFLRNRNFIDIYFYIYYLLINKKKFLQLLHVLDKKKYIQSKYLSCKNSSSPKIIGQRSQNTFENSGASE